MCRSVIRRNAQNRLRCIDSSPRARAGRRGGWGSRATARATLALDKGTVLANEQIEMVALLIGKLEEDLFAL
jgi:hypothetical protein